MAMLDLKDKSDSELLTAFSKSAPVDVYGLADALNLTVRRRDFPDSISGKIERGRLFGGFVISVNQNHSPTRQRFTLAHEIAHYILHRDKIGDGIIDDALYRSNRGDSIEREANFFAATILMPAPLVIAAFRGGNRSIAGISKQFDVSYAVAEIRMKELRLG
jgi:Zn-dependent peptidase ImmA (M78 family)